MNRWIPPGNASITAARNVLSASYVHEARRASKQPSARVVKTSKGDASSGVASTPSRLGALPNGMTTISSRPSRIVRKMNSCAAARGATGRPNGA